MLQDTLRTPPFPPFFPSPPLSPPNTPTLSPPNTPAYPHSQMAVTAVMALLRRASDYLGTNLAPHLASIAQSGSAPAAVSQRQGVVRLALGFVGSA